MLFIPVLNILHPEDNFSNVGNAHTHTHTHTHNPEKLRKNEGNDMALLRNIATLSLLAPVNL